MNMARCMIKGKKHPRYLWGEAVTTTDYIMKKSPTKRLHDLTPEEAFFGKKPYVGNLRIFGSPCYRYVLVEKRKKLDDRVELMIFIGYHHTGAYKLFNPWTKRVITSRDVVFDEGSISN